MAFVIPWTVPVNVGLLIGARKPIEFVTVVEKLASPAIALLNSNNVFNNSGLPSTKLAIEEST